MSIRLLFAIVAIVLGAVLILVDSDVDPEVLAGAGIICAALAAIVDR